MLSCLTLALALAAPPADDPKAVIEKAIKAHGGAELLKKYPAHRATSRGTVWAAGMEMAMVGESVGVLPDKLRLKGTLTIAGQETPIEQVIRGGTFRMTLGGNVIPVPDEQAADAVVSLYTASLTRLTPLLTADYTLKPAAAAEVGGKTAVGVVVGHKDRPDVTLYFDAGSGRLVKTSRKGKAEDGSDADRDTLYLDYKAVGGLQVSHRETVTVGGKKTEDFTVEKFELLEAVPDAEFVIGD